MGVMDSDMAVCVIQDKFPTSKERSKIVLHLDLKASVESLYDTVAKTYHIPIASFQLSLENLPTAEIVYLDEMKAKTLGESHFVVGRDVRNSVTIFDKINAIPLQTPPMVVESSVFALCIIRDMTTDSCQTKRTNLRMASSSTVQRLFEVVGQTLSYDPATFDLLLQRSAGRDVACLKETSKATLAEAGFDFTEDARNMLVVTNKSKTSIRRLGATERPAEIVMDFNAPITATRVVSQAVVPATAELLPSAVSFIKPETIGYVGLVNQAMTCYLNSLLQTLFMTPEFRNAMYRWQFDGNREESVKSIPFQLQKLFVKLQTSNRSAIETTELTRSFGWDSSEAWQQHDIQELCRVMFDALEQKFKRTDQADLIARLYEGKMIDYVKCLDCGIEKMREDTFLDIPLPVRPFGSAVAYPSVEEALRAFVQPELLDGNNQYFCDKCTRKCDAHKGLKFSRFPYLLTLHLKRFDFDYNTLHRIKLNDKVTFPEILNLNGFVETAQTVHDNSANNVPGHLVGNTHVINEPSAETQDDDEGIDVDAETAASHAAENEKNRLKAMEKGPFVYELFSIMIHSGSASGGHYYAYIKDFGNGEWFCFNDQSVSRITYDDIRKTYGGSATRSYYSGAYSSSTNAYMLMYRQVDKSRNVNFTAKEVFPSHIQGLLQRMEEDEESERMAREKERNTLRTKLFCHHPNKGKMELNFGVCKDLTVREVTRQAYEDLQLQDLVAFKQCRLVKYDDLSDSPECSFEDREDESIGEVLGNEKGSGKLNLLLEIVPPGHAFVVYKSGESSIKVYVVDMETEEIGGPVTLRVPLDATVAQLKEEISVSVATSVSKLRLVLRSSQCSASLLLHDEKALKWTGFARNNEVFADISGIPEVETTFLKSTFYRAIMRFENTIDVHITLPHIDKDSLTRMGITLMSPAHITDGLYGKAHLPWSLNDAADLQEDMADLEHLERRRAFSEGEHDGDDCRSTSPQPASAPSSENEDEGIGDADDGVLHSASEEASLADSDKTLLGDPPEDSFRAPSRTHSPDKEFHPEERDEVKVEELNAMRHIRMSRYHDHEISQEVATVSVDRRLRLSALKWFLGPRLGVHADYLRIYRVQTTSGLEKECLSMNETIESCGENPKLVVRLGRALKPGEVRGKIYQLTPNDAEPANFLFEWVFRSGLTVGEAKKEIVEEARTHHDLAWNPDECILRKKNWRNPASIYHDSQIFGTDIAIYTNWEMFFQKLESHQKLDELKKAELTLFTRRWRPSEMVLEQFVEVSLPSVKGETLKEKLSQMSEIPVENLAVAKSPGTFPCEMSVLSIPSKLTWLTEIQDLDEWPLNVSEDGAVLLYKDNTEVLKVLSDEERNELASKENLRLNQNEFPTIVPSTRKERGLKIYVEPAANATTETS